MDLHFTLLVGRIRHLRVAIAECKDSRLPGYLQTGRQESICGINNYQRYL
jgi:hypothetical protein